MDNIKIRSFCLCNPWKIMIFSCLNLFWKDKLGMAKELQKGQ